MFDVISVAPIPTPSILTPLVIITFDAHVNVPAGSEIVSPSCASVSWMNWTFVDEPSES
jgi:hypothetical protein